MAGMTSLPAGVRLVGMSQEGASILVLRWSNDTITQHPVRAIRLAGPCAECVDEWTNQPRLDPDSVPADVQPLRIEPVGLYGVQIAWSDGHGTGIYTFETLWGLASETPDSPPSE